MLLRRSRRSLLLRAATVGLARGSHAEALLAGDRKIPYDFHDRPARLRGGQFTPTGGITAMTDVFVGKVGDLPDGERRIVMHGGTEIGVFHWEGRFYAYENMCVHQGGPACEGVIMHKVEDVLAPDRTWQGQTFSKTQVHFVCPWHGWE